MNLIKSYQNLILAHKEQTNILDAQLKHVQEQDSNATVITSEHIIKTVNALFKLEINGSLISDFYTKQQHLRQQESLLRTEKNVDASVWKKFKKGYNKLVPNMMKLA